MTKYKYVRHEDAVKTLAAVAGALSDASRLRALSVLRRGELCACQLIALLGLAPSTVSRHMAVLRRAGLVRNRKEKRWMHFRLPELSVMSPHVRNALQWVFQSLKGDKKVQEDLKRLTRILRQPPEILCLKRRRN